MSTTQDVAGTPALLNFVADAIEAEPLRYNQSYWVTYFNAPGAPDVEYFRPSEVDLYNSSTLCGTAYCVAGWALVLAGVCIAPPASEADLGLEAASPDEAGRLEDLGFTGVAAELLGLPYGVAFLLFSDDWLPRHAYSMDPPEVKARYAAEALRALASGSSLAEVTNPHVTRWWDERFREAATLRWDGQGWS